MSLVELRDTLCRVGNIFLVSIGLMSPVDFEKWPCRPVEFEGRGPYLSRACPLTCNVPPFLGTLLLIRRNATIIMRG